MAWTLLLIAIALEVFATSMLNLSHGFTRLWPSIALVLGYAGSFYLLSLVLRSLPLGVTYATWSALGTIAVAVIGAFFFGQRLTLVQIAGLVIAVAGIALLNLGGDVHANPDDTATSITQANPDDR
ncbi:MAG TPA: multidrug efflux SMR transporter [Pseudoclavibacter sp.]|nr:multidrug efflux SMR transporter [Pseudoclavibacter sp.]